MADAIISSVVDQLFIIIKDQGQELRAALGVEKEIKNLSSKLNKIRAVLNDAERRSFNEEIVKLWVDEIKDFCYDVEDVVDEWNTRSRRQQIERSPEVAGSCSSFLPCCFHFKKIVMHRDIAKKIKELDSRLYRITREKDQLKFDDAASVARTHISGQEWKRVTTTSFVDASEIQGRDIDASALISKLVEDNNNDNGPPVVISIVGAGGIGKTTLAQLVYGHQQIKAHFDERVWVCVSHPFDQIKIAKAIVESTTKSSTDLSQLEMLLEKIQSTLSQKRFLLVLDDVWTEEYAKWEPFKNCFKDLIKNCREDLSKKCSGSRILVTTRSERVARMMGSVYLHPVELISDSDAWLLLSRMAFDSREEAYSEKLKDIGQKIAQRCRGLPLAVKVMGSLLRCKDTEEEWQYVLSNLDDKFWKTEKVETELFHHLYLSYDDLTPQMKRCFSYYAVFPKDYEIKVDELIRIWMAQGYLTTTNGSDHNKMEQKGREVFGNLAMRSLFQDIEEVDMDSNIAIIFCKMHDIVHDFAEFLTKNECCSVDLKENKVKIENLRHLSWQKTGKPMDIASICDLGKLRSFFAEHLSTKQLPPNMFNHLKSVRVLGLHNCMLSKLPKEIGNLLHLRYIDLSRSNVEKLPDSICSLDNLQTLNLRRCEYLSRLPEGIGNLRQLNKIDLSQSRVKELPDSICSLANLEILYLEGCEYLSRLPEGIGNLRQLSNIDLSKSGVKELPDSICSLDNLQTLNLRGCECLSRLPEGIGNLRHLSEIYLSSSKVEELPDSICSLDNFETLNLRGCDCLSRLPKEIGNLRHLSEIYLSQSGVKELPDSICSLDSLQTLDLGGCECLSRLPEGIGNLRQLSKIDLSRSGVKELPDSICSLDSLKILNLEGCDFLSRLPERIGNLRNLSEIDLSRSNVEELPYSICSLDNLKIINLEGCDCLSRLPERIGNLRNLIEIDLRYCKVEELPDSICSLDNLKSLYLAGCQCLSRLPEGIGNLHKLRNIDLSRTKVEELPDSICSLDNLEILILQGCECLSKLPEGIGNLRHLSKIYLSRSKVEELPDSICSLDDLEILDLEGCECLSRLPEGIGNMRHLSKIDLSESGVKELPDSICSLDNLQTLNLGGSREKMKKRDNPSRFFASTYTKSWSPILCTSVPTKICILIPRLYYRKLAHGRISWRCHCATSAIAIN
nr:putative disease resistance protein RGA3 [Ipomoea batatas]